MQKSILDFFSKPKVKDSLKDKKEKDSENLKDKYVDKSSKNDNFKNQNKDISQNLNNKSYTRFTDDNLLLTNSPKRKRLKPMSDDDSDSDKENNVRNGKIISGNSENKTKSSPLPSNKKMKITPTKVVECSNDTLNKRINLNSPTPSKKLVTQKPITPSTRVFLTQFEKKPDNSNNDLNQSVQVIDEEAATEEGFDHLSLAFLKKEFLMDNRKHRPNHPEYDGTTLYVPEEFMSKVSPAMRQWWQLKANGFYDTLLFFKVGKFYELYHMDAVIAVNQLGISYMRGSYAHCGFPEITFTKMSDQLVQKGFKVARVEQTETVDAMTERCKKKPTKDKVVNREVCQIVTPGTRTFSLRNSSTRPMYQDEGEDLSFDDNVGAILYSIKEVPTEKFFKNKSRNVIEIGLSFVNTNTGKFILAQFEDDILRSKLRTIFSQFCPNEIIYQKSDLSKDTQHLLNTTLAAVKKEGLFKNKQFLSAENALERLLEGDYFLDTPKDRISNFGLPIGLTEVLNEGDNLGRSPAPHFSLAVNSLGGLIYYLQKCLIDKYLISLGDFNVYHPPDECTGSNFSEVNSTPFYLYQSNMILDSSALSNLDLLRNSNTGTIEGTLLERVDFTCTSFGKRLLRQWIASPLCHPESILERQAGISELIDLDPILGQIKQKLKSLPDLEKLISRIHAIGLTKSVTNHPDSRAVLYENLQYSKRKINDFVVAISSFKTIIDIQSRFCELNFEKKLHSALLKKISLCEQDHDTGTFPFLNDVIDFFQKAFDHDQARKEGKIIPERGVDEDYDNSMQEIKEVEKELSNYLSEQRSLLGCTINYFGTARNRYQLEIPESKSQNVPRTYFATSQRKGFKRYETSETIRLLAEMTSAEEKRDVALKTIMSHIFAKFDENFPIFTRTINCLAQLDALISLACFSRGVDGGPMIKPEIQHLDLGKKPFLLITEGRYPCKAKTQTGEFISNTVKLGVSNEDKRVMILTGPNMGGKSTLMRQTGLIIILAQMGCYVPAEGPVIMTPVDRLLTRQGASDSVGSGQSTLQVEMNETASILSYMTMHSFLLVDELGRGTATHDGCALACSILNSLVDKCEPRTIFSTHFHKLLEEKQVIDKIQLGHMACMVEDDIDSLSSNETKLQYITFLYKLTAGGCPKSYGFNVARLADIPEKIILNGLKISKKFEEETIISEFKKFLTVSKQHKRSCTDEMEKWQNKFKRLYNI